jgi:hypothetical protein
MSSNLNILELRYENKVHTDQKEILKILKKEKIFNWLIDSTISDATIEIKNKTLIWHNGVYTDGEWEYGIFKDGQFYGEWVNGIWEKGYFNSDIYNEVQISRGVFSLEAK